VANRTSTYELKYDDVILGAEDAHRGASCAFNAFTFSDPAENGAVAIAHLHVPFGTGGATIDSNAIASHQQRCAAR
jgi:hypothetical protein